MTYSLEALLGMVIVASIIVLFMKHGFTALMKRINAIPANVLAPTHFILPVLLYDMLYCYHAMYQTRSHYILWKHTLPWRRQETADKETS